MSSTPQRSLVRYDAALSFGGGGSGGIFCAAPTVLEAINFVLHRQGLSLLWVQADGTIGPADPLLAAIEFNPNPIVN